ETRAGVRKDHAANRPEVLYSTARNGLLRKGRTLTLAAADWAAIVGYLLITLFLGLYFRGRSGKSTEDYFVSGRNVSWWLAGTSMVATTFAADTPLAVTGLVYANGVAGNWLWWSFLPSGMMTVFLFARMWRRSGLITDVQFAEFRYSGKPAAFLRGFRAVYLGLLMNCLILGWVTKAMVNIISTSLGVSDAKALAICVFFLMSFTRMDGRGPVDLAGDHLCCASGGAMVGVLVSRSGTRRRRLHRAADFQRQR